MATNTNKGQTMDIQKATLDAIADLWFEGGTNGDAAAAGWDLFEDLNADLILDAPDLMFDTLEAVYAALPPGFPTAP